jgi:hypothetical protein
VPHVSFKPQSDSPFCGCNMVDLDCLLDGVEHYALVVRWVFPTIVLSFSGIV